MGYLDDEISNCPAQLELDCYDYYYGRRGAIHLVAKVHGEDEVAGTVRLVMAREVSGDVQKSVIGSPPKSTMEAQAKFIRQILAKRDSTGFLRQRLNATYFATLPILQSTEFSTKGRDILKAAGDAAELSRLVVAPMYRGLGVSKLLVRAIISIALNLKKELLLLECIPAHVPMYEKYGFEPIAGTHCRAQDLDQMAVAMMLRPRRVMDRVAAMAEKDLEMIQSSSGQSDPNMLFGRNHLCLCSDSGCWSNAGYTSRTKQCCPLRHLHSRTVYPKLQKKQQHPECLEAI
jgi:GNAT superfamily N-acetyltransferase